MHTVILEALNTLGMTPSARGTQAEPGTHVQPPAGLNRAILASNWGQREQRLAYQCGRWAKVDPKRPRQPSHQCGHVSTDNRKTQAVFHCQQCGLRMQADHNAAINLVVRYARTAARGTGATVRRAAFSLETAMTREQDIPTYPNECVLKCISPIKKRGA